MKLRRILAVCLIAVLAIGCTAQQWFQLVNALLPLATDIAVQFYTYSNKGTLSAAEAAAIQKYSTDVQAIFQDIGADVTAWQTSKDPSRLAHITALLANLKTQSAALITQFGLSPSDPTTAFITALVQDAVDLAGLIPIVVQTRSSTIDGTETRYYKVTMRISLPKAQSLVDVFKSRVANLPK